MSAAWSPWLAVEEEEEEATTGHRAAPTPPHPPLAHQLLLAGANPNHEPEVKAEWFTQGRPAVEKTAQFHRAKPWTTCGSGFLGLAEGLTKVPWNFLFLSRAGA